MQYDPIKNTLAGIVKRNVFLRKIFYRILGTIFLREWYVRRKVKLLEQRGLPLCPRILDAGCGFGQYTYFMARYFSDAEILGIDVKVDQIEDCRYFFGRAGFTNCKFKVEDLTKIDYENAFDFILSVDVMEHIEEDEEVFKRFYRALKPGGKVLINTPSDLGGSGVEISSPSPPSKGESAGFIGEHVRTGYSRKEIYSKLLIAGFSIGSFEYTYGKWGTRYWKLGIKIPMLMLNKSQAFFLLLLFYYLFTIWFVWLFMFLDFKEKNKMQGTGILVVGMK